MKPTPIPEDGWTDEDIGRTVFLKMPHGTIVEDRIVFINSPDGTQLIGPATELGALAARMSYVIPILQAHDEWLMSMDDNTESDEQ
tara:strand:- start:261 stop:518 length:258 start_codon:yes stop_codon:yes gene_type:complete